VLGRGRWSPAVDAQGILSKDALVSALPLLALAQFGALFRYRRAFVPEGEAPARYDATQARDESRRFGKNAGRSLRRVSRRCAQ